MIRFSIYAILFFISPSLFAACAKTGQFQFDATALTLKYCDGTNQYHVAGAATGGACSKQGQITYSAGVLTVCDGTNLLTVAITAGSACTKAGQIQFNTPNLQYCDGTNWQTMNPAKAYFILSFFGGHTANYGGLSGADSACLTDLQTSTWLGQSSAVLNSAMVHSFLCDASTCNTLKASTTYTFAATGDASGGSATFTTDASGLGPNDSATWDDATHFNKLNKGITTGRAAGGSNTAWPSTPSGVNCSSWSTTTGNQTTGGTSQTTSNRWNVSSSACSGGFRMICYVDP